MTTGKTIALTIQAFVGKVMSLLFNMMSRIVIVFLPKSKRLLVSWLQSLSSDFGAQENKICHCLHFFPSISHEVMVSNAMILLFLMLSLSFKPTIFKTAIIGQSEEPGWELGSLSLWLRFLGNLALAIPSDFPVLNLAPHCPVTAVSKLDDPWHRLTCLLPHRVQQTHRLQWTPFEGVCGTQGPLLWEPRLSQ